jgi:hypothetical protein
MIENLLHADIVLSKRDLQQIAQVGANVPAERTSVKLGVITFLAFNPSTRTATLLVRVDPDHWMSLTGWMTLMQFDGDFKLQVGNTVSTVNDTYTRYVVEVVVRERLRDPVKFIHSQARRIVRYVVRDWLSARAIA